jgi:two-component system, NarL family, invasion response regulator UvrY
MNGLGARDVWRELTLMCSEGAAPHEATVLVAVSSQRVREALVAMVGALEGFRVVGEAKSADQAVQLARATRPALAVVDDDFADCGSAWTIQQLCQERLAQAVVAVGWRASGAQRARAAGAHLYVEMGTPPEDVLSALRDVCPARS